MFTKEQILDELRRVAAELGRTPGRRTFEIETGVRESDWSGRYWIRWSDALAEAGLAANTMQGRYEDADLAALLAAETRRIGHFPNSLELRMRSREHPDFPDSKTFQSRGGKAGMIRLVRDFCEDNPDEWRDVLALLPDDITAPTAVTPAKAEPELVLGYVYLVKSGKRYKIGMSTDVQRRLLQLNTGMPDAGQLVHVINTDDPVGIEAYWHRRFAAKRVRPDAEWFDLSAEDVRAFRRRKFQ